MTVQYTPVSAIPKIVANMKKAFLTHRTQSLEFRKEQLRALLRAVTENEDAMVEAIRIDLNRHKDNEVPTIKGAIQGFIDNLEDLTKQTNVAGFHEKDECSVRLSPLGTVLIIGAWNFPMMLNIEPIAGAIAAGNNVVLKPSEVSAHSAHLLTQMMEKYMDPQVVQVVNGAVEETSALLKERFDHIFYTGGTEVGRIVMVAAAKNLTPVTLELGGKCPVIVTEHTDIAKAAQAIAGTKTFNCGQVCLTVDYVLCPKHLRESLIQGCIATWKHMFTEDAGSCATYPKIINARQHARLEKLLATVKQQNTVVYGGRSDASQRFIEPTIVTGVTLKDEIMQDEIFGPILPIVDCDNLQDAIDIINQNEHPLALYVFSDNKAEVEKVIRETRSGGVTVNQLATHFYNHNLPFGGVGNSGIGNYHGKFSIDTFSHKRAVMIRSQAHL
ncbi:aldehyde dehydrogenase 3, member A2 [Podila clonocystis]|nr:aldehyde dehydrogenase 3, member A2 [Podila clonocystis]